MGKVQWSIETIVSTVFFLFFSSIPRKGVQGDKKTNFMANIIWSSSLKKDNAREDCRVICLSICNGRKHIRKISERNHLSVCETPAVLCFKKAALRPEESSHSILRWHVSAVRAQWNTCWLQGIRKAQSQRVHLFVHLSPVQRFPTWQGALLRLISPTSPLTSSLIMLIRRAGCCLTLVRVKQVCLYSSALQCTI